MLSLPNRPASAVTCFETALHANRQCFILFACLYCLTGIERFIRDFPPAHYTFKIESFNVLSNTEEFERYETGDFEAGGYKWRLSLYPNGNKKRNGHRYISLYLAISEPDTLPLGWEVNVDFKLFVYDQIRDKYLTIQDLDGGVKRFHRLRTEWGFARLISLESFNDASNGYLVDDSCIFGAEVFVIKCTGKWECLTMLKQPVGNTCTLKIQNFSAQLDTSYHYSNVFIVGERKWYLLVYPKGYSSATGEALSLYLELVDWGSLPSKRKLYAEYKFRIKDQVHMNHYERTGKNWFSASSDWGYSNFITLSDLNQASKGFIKNDALIVEGEITVMSMIKVSS
ncbi:hypothetical protein L1049_018721 [Liquidambar formosana]|uniref:MATH domain-containing protein n=1 Tax=Liquidambar formosana TaxID=63359 RepID=A0AAP0WMM0_LIQFO